MPTYVYQVINKDGSDGERFEVVQSMSDPHLEKHPHTGEPVRRVYLPPNIGSKFGERGVNQKLDPKSVEKAGFTRYEKDKSTGTYHRTAGKEGPDTFRP
jgi:hypothetical protein